MTDIKGNLSPKVQNRPPRIEFALKGDLSKQYTELVTCAEKLGVEVNLFDKEFERFLRRQFRSFNRQLQRIKAGSMVLKRPD